MGRRVLTTLAFLIPLLVQAQDFSGSLVGTITDSSGGRIAEAEITLANSEHAISRHAIGNTRGEFRFDHLPPGAYQVNVKSNGFSEA